MTYARYPDRLKGPMSRNQANAPAPTFPAHAFAFRRFAIRPTFRSAVATEKPMAMIASGAPPRRRKRTKAAAHNGAAFYRPMIGKPCSEEAANEASFAAIRVGWFL